MDTQRSATHVRVGPQGRIVIPAPLRRQLGIEPGETVIARVENGCLVLETTANAIRRLQEPFTRLPEGVSLASELIAERRREAARELED